MYSRKHYERRVFIIFLFVGKMNIICVICMDELEAEANLQSTRCGHIFHHDCLLHWIRNSRTCPQCRKGVKSNELCQLYPTFSDEQSKEISELQSSLDDALKGLGQLQTACEEKDIRLKNITDNFNEQRRRETLLQSQNTDLAELRRQLEQFKKENEDLKRQLRSQRWQHTQVDQIHQVEMLKCSLECSRSRELALNRQVQQLQQDSIIREPIIGIISATIGFALGVLFYPYIYPIPVQQSCWQKSVGYVSSYFNRMF